MLELFHLFLHPNVDLVFWKIENKNPTQTKILLGPTVLKNENEKHFENRGTKKALNIITSYSQHFESTAMYYSPLSNTNSGFY